MATSGTVSFKATLQEICRHAGIKVSAVAAGITMSDAVYQDFRFNLNAMVKRWSVKGIKVWTRRKATLFPVPSQAQYTLGHETAALNSHCTESYEETALAVAASSGATSITVDSDAGISDNDFIGIMLDSGSIFWTTVNGAPAANVVQIDDALTGDAAVDNVVYAYTSKITKPIFIEGVRRKTISGHIITPCDRMWSRQEFEDLPQHETDGALSAPWYDRQIVAGYLNLWPRPASPLVDLVEFTWARPIEDFTAVGENPDLPEEWTDTLIWNLAKMMLGDYPVSPVRAQRIEERAEELLGDMASVDREQEAVFVQPDMRAYRQRRFR